jgi:tetratricopeptide (TPR) repeat protein
MISSELTRIAEISRAAFGSEDDLIHKIILPFFQVIGYGPDLLELKFPVKAYRPNRRGRKPEADCVFFSSSTHDLRSSLLVAEIKRDDQQSPEHQARFYSANLFVPFYVSWSRLEFEVWQVQNFRPPVLVSRHRLDQIDRVSLSELKELLAPNQIVKFCAQNEIKEFDLDEGRKAIEVRYLSRLAIDLRSFKALDLPEIRDLDAHYVELRLRELEVIPLRDVEEEIEQGVHPGTLEQKSEGDRTFSVSDLLDKMSAIVVIGDPGAGKTTLLRRLCLDNAYADSRLLPILVSIRDVVSTEETVVESALRQISRYGNTDNPGYLYDAALAQGRILLCVDGIDELGIDEPRDARAAVVRFNADLSNILTRHPGNRVVISARRESWPVCRPLLPQSLRELVVLPFTRSAVRVFVLKWFAESPKNAERVIDSFRARDWPSYATNPLLLTLTCACIPVQGDVPKRTSELFSRFLSFILEQWDSTRRISERPPVPNLNPETTSQLLAEVALAFHLRRRAALARSEVINLLADHLPLLGLPTPTPRDVFLELTKQHGLLRSWSIDQHYAFSHLSFESYFAAKALRSQVDGHRTIANHKDDPFWHEALILYAELGDISNLARELLATDANLLQPALLLLSECWAAGGEIKDFDLSRSALDRLLALARGKITFLADQAINLLARISIPEAKTAFASMIRDSKGHFTKGIASRFAVSVLGDAILPEVVAQLVRTGHNEDLLENFLCLPRRVAIEQLRELVLRTDFPTSRDAGVRHLRRDAGVRHLRRDAEELMAKAGEELAISPLIQLMSAPQLSDFEKSGCVSALATIDDLRIPQILRDIVSGSFPMDCRILAALKLAPGEPEARRFLLKVIADEGQDYFDRRDAAAALARFDGLTDDDLPAFRPLIFDRQPTFVGGPDVAVSTVGKIGTKAARALLKEALAFWEKSDYEEAWRVRGAVLQALNLEDKTADLRTILEKAGTDRWINTELPNVASEYFRREPEKANELFESALRSYNRDAVYMGTVAWAVLIILPQIPLSDKLLEAAINLAKRLPRAILPWSAISKVWQRRDISDPQRALFKN